MNGRTVVQVHFDGEWGRPVAVSKKARLRGRRVMVEIEREALLAGSVLLLHRADMSEIVLAASTKRQNVERVRAGPGTAATAYEITSVPMLEVVG